MSDRRKPIIRRASNRQIDWGTQDVTTRTVLDLIAPDSMELRHRDYIMSAGTYYRHLAIIGFPASTTFGYLLGLLTQPGINLVQEVNPLNEYQTSRLLGRTRRAAQATLADGADIAQAELGLSDVQKVRLRVARGQERIFEYAIYIQIRGSSPDELQTRTATVETQLHNLGLTFIHCSYRQKQGFDAFLPLGIDLLRVFNLVDTSTIARGFLFSSSTLNITAGPCPNFYGLGVGRSGPTGDKILIDPFAQSNPHLAILASSGAGKSYFAKYETILNLIYGRRVFIIDPEHEYESFARTLDGTFIRIAAGTPHRINPFDLPHTSQVPDDEADTADEDIRDVLMEKVARLTAWLETAIAGQPLTPTLRAKLEETILQTYRSKGITRDPHTHDQPPPIMADLLPHLEQGLPELDAAAAVRRLIEGTLAMFNGQTNVDLSAPLIVWGYRDIDTEELQSQAAMLTFEHIWTFARNRPNYQADPITVLVDEGWTILQNTVGGQLLATTIRRGRKYWLRLVLATQRVGDVTETRIGRTILANCWMKLLMQMEPDEIHRAQETFDLKPGETAFLETCQNTRRYSDALLGVGRQRIGLRIPRAPDIIHGLITAAELQGA